MTVISDEYMQQMLAKTKEQKVTVLDVHRTEEPKDVSYQEFSDVLDSVWDSIEQLRKTRKDQGKLDEAQGYLKEMRFCAMMSQHFRKTYLRPLEELLDDLYIEIHG